MRRLALFSIILLSFCECYSQISAQDIATFATKSIDALINKREMEDAFKLEKVIGQWCLDMGMEREEVAEYYGMKIWGYIYVGQDSVQIDIRPFDGYIEGRKVTLITIGIFKYKSTIPMKYKDAIWKEFCKCGWYNQESDKRKFPHEISVYDEEKRNGYAIVMTLGEF